MMLKALTSLIKSFKRQDKIEEITSPEQLSTGDMLRFAHSFALPEGLRGETFQVKKVATYFYSDVASPQFVIKSSDQTPFYLATEDFDGEELIVISKKLKSKEVESLFGWHQLRKSIKNKDSLEIAIIDEAKAENWAAKRYSRGVFGATGCYFESDVRHADGIPPGGEKFRYFEYYTADEGKSLEIEVWEGNEIEVCLGLVRPMTDIAEFWKKS